MNQRHPEGTRSKEKRRMKGLLILGIAILLLVSASVTGCANKEQLTEAYNEGYQAGYDEAYTAAYIDNVAIVGTLTGKTNPVIVKITNALCDAALSLSMAPKDEAVPEITFTAHYLNTDLDTEPWSITYPERGDESESCIVIPNQHGSWG